MRFSDWSSYGCSADLYNPPAFGMTVDSARGGLVGGLVRLACYHSAVGKVAVERLGAHRIELRFDRAFPTGRSRVNCTLPGPEGRWRWFGTQFYVAPTHSAERTPSREGRAVQ